VAFVTAKLAALAGSDSPDPATARDVRLSRTPRTPAVPPARAFRSLALVTPRELAAHRWRDVARRVFRGFLDDRIMAEAAGVTFYAMLALFPALASMISLYGLLGDPRALADNVRGLDGILPGGGIDIIRTQVTALAGNPPSALGFGFLLGLAVSLWSANAGVKALFDALNVVYHEREKRGFVRLTLISFAFTFGLLGVVIAATFAVLIVPVVLNFVGFGDAAAAALNLLRWPVMLVMVGFALSFVYRYGPSRPQARWRWISWGSAFASVAWVVTSLAFSAYVSHFGSYNKTYGSLGAAMGFMTWIWLSAIVVLLGAELNVNVEEREVQ
jgi:membrane protein